MKPILGSRAVATGNIVTTWPKARGMGNSWARRPGRTGFALAVGSMLGILLLSNLSSAESSPRGKLEGFFGRATAILSAATDAQEARDDMRDLARPLVDGHRAARRALGPEWDRRTEAERDEFARTFRGVVENAYVQIVQARLPRGGPAAVVVNAYVQIVQARLPRGEPPAIRVIGEVVAEGAAIVRTQVPSRQGGDVQVDYVMGESEETWLVRDVVIDGVSLVDNYRAQIARVLRTSSYADLVARFRTVGGTAMPEPLAAAPSPAAAEF